MPANKPLEWKGHHQLSAASPQAPCLPLRGSAGRQTKQPVAHPYLLGYTEAWLKSGRRLPMPRGLLHCATGLQGLVPVGDGVSELRIHYGPGSRLSDLSDKESRCGRHFACRRRQEFPRHGYSSGQRHCSKSLGESNDQNHHDNLGPSRTPCHCR